MGPVRLWTRADATSKKFLASGAPRRFVGQRLGLRRPLQAGLSARRDLRRLRACRPGRPAQPKGLPHALRSSYLRLAAIVGPVHNLVYNLPHKLSRKSLELPNVWLAIA